MLPCSARDVADWVRQASSLPVPEAGRAGEASRRGAAVVDDGDAHVALHVRTNLGRPGQTPRAASLASKGRALQLSEDGGSSEDADESASQRRAAGDARTSIGGGASTDGGGGAAGSFHGSMVDGSEMASDNGDAASGGGDLGHEEDLAVDTRCEAALRAHGASELPWLAARRPAAARAPRVTAPPAACARAPAALAGARSA